MLCIPIKSPSRELLSKAGMFADLIELRLDYFESIDKNNLSLLRKEFPIPMIFTLKNSSLSEIYSLCGHLKPEYLDLEFDVAKRIHNLHPEIGLIVSHHDYKATPSKKDLDALYNQMLKIPARFYKIATTAINILDTLRLLCWAKQKQDPRIIAIAMGTDGQLSRIWNTPLSYATLNDNESTAPGQFTADLLTERFGFRNINKQTAIYGLIGDPVDQSIGDVTHNATFKKEKVNAIYIKMRVESSELTEFLQLAKQLPFKGLSVTMPLKEHILPLLDRIDPEAEKIGAVNTLVFENDQTITGYNTDGIGALEAIGGVENKKIVILGAGGAAKAIIFEAKKRGAMVSVLNRHFDRAEEVANRFNCHADTIENLISHDYDILINTTSIDMPIHENGIKPKSIVMDIKTNTQESTFLDLAKKKGCHIIPGYSMFINQAIGQFRLWLK